jgi:hypothetical protein
MVLRVDVSPPTFVQDNGAPASTCTTASFTPPANSLLVALVSAGTDGSTGAPVAALSDSLVSNWAQVVTSDISAAAADIWVLDAGAAPAARTVTVTQSGGTVIKKTSLRVLVFTGAASAAAHVATAVTGHFTGAGSTACGIGVTITRVGSFLVCSGSCPDGNSVSGTIYPTQVNGVTFQTALGVSNTLSYGYTSSSQMGLVQLGWTGSYAANGGMSAMEVMAAQPPLATTSMGIRN